MFSDLESLYCAIMPCQKGSLMHYNFLIKKYNDILYLEVIKKRNSKLRIVCKPNYNIDDVLKFTKELVLGLDYEIVVEDKSDVIKTESSISSSI